MMQASRVSFWLVRASKRVQWIERRDTMSSTHASFIVTSHALVAAVVLLLIVWIIADYRRQQARLKEIEASGITRRSGRSAADIR